MRAAPPLPVARAPVCSQHHGAPLSALEYQHRAWTLLDKSWANACLISIIGDSNRDGNPPGQDGTPRDGSLEKRRINAIPDTRVDVTDGPTGTFNPRVVVSIPTRLTRALPRNDAEIHVLPAQAERHGHRVARFQPVG